MIRAVALAGAILAVGALPLALPTDLTVVRAFFAAVCVCWMVKLADLMRGRVKDPTMLRGGWLLLWLMIPPQTRRPRDDEDRRVIAHRGWIRLRNGALQAVVLLALLIAITLWPELHDVSVAGTVTGLALVYLVITGLANAIGGVVMVAGIDVANPFNAPLLSRSSREFWGKRWNLFVHRAAYRHLFLPAGGVRHPIRATVVVFLGSAIMHEYLIVAAVGGIPETIGMMSAFFAIHGLAVLVEMKLRRRPSLPTALARGLFLAFMVATAPLFLQPTDLAFGYTTWRLW